MNTTILTSEQKLNIIEVIENGIEDNKSVAELLNVSASQVSSVRYWFTRNGITYKNNIQNQINQANEKAKNLNALYSKLKNDFKNVSGSGKQEARELMVQYISNAKKSGLKNGKIATLPSNTWAIEDLIYNNVSKRFKYVACERESAVFVEMVNKMNKYGNHNNAILGSLSDVIYNAQENEFDHIIADYCGVLSSFKDELLHACSKNVVKVGGTIAVTTLKARNKSEFVSKLNHFKSELSGLDCENNDNETAIKMFFKSLAAITNFEVVEEFTYCDTTPMMLVILKRTK